MPLQIDSDWVFSDSGVEMPLEFHREAVRLVDKIASRSSNPKGVYEEMKIAFGHNHNSSSLSFAETDCNSAMRSRIDNAPHYLSSLYDGIERLSEYTEVPDDLPVYLNRLLRECDAPVTIKDWKVVLTDGDSVISDTDDEAEEEEDEATPLRYNIEEEIGSGAFGKVYRATRDTSLGVFEFALKLLNPSRFLERPDKALLRFQRELKVLSGLRHKGIVSYFDAGKDRDGKPFIVMELVDGPDLRDYLSGRPAKEVRRVFLQISSALSYVHSQGVLHRDIKPSNIRVRDSDKQPVILDFGCAFFEDDSERLSITSKEVGSYAYIPPEVIANPKLRHEKQDVYALGVVLFEVVANCLPNRDSLESLSTVDDQYAAFDEIVQSALAPAPDRIPSVSRFRKMLKALEV